MKHSKEKIEKKEIENDKENTTAILDKKELQTQLQISEEKNTCKQEKIAEKHQNWFVRLWNYYSTYEKIWLFSICTIGILLGIFFPEDPNERTWLRVIEIIVVIGGCSCELLLSKQSKWAFIVSFVLYDTTQTIVYFANGLYISALFEIIFWIPILFVGFYLWGKKSDGENKNLTKVKAVNWARDAVIFAGILAVSLVTGFLFTSIGILAEGMPDWWYLDALANAFSVCNGLFLVLRYREQWVAWLGVAITESIIWILNGQYILLVLEIGYLMNSLYGFIMWQKYIRGHKKCWIHPKINNFNYPTKLYSLKSQKVLKAKVKE